MRTAIIIVNYKTPWHLKKCLESVFENTKDFKVFVVHNAPDAESLSVGQFFRNKFSDKVQIYESVKNLGFVAGVNLAYPEAIEFDRVCLLNSDTIVTKGWLSELNKVLDEDQSIVQVSPDSNSYYNDDSIWRIIRLVPILKNFHYLQHNFNPPTSFTKDENFKEAKFYEYKEFYRFCGGFCNVFRSEHFKDLGYFLDPNIVHGYWDDFDLSMYLKQFGKVGFTNKSYVYHFVNVSFNKINESKKNMKKMLHLLNGLYVMNKWESKVLEYLSAMSKQELFARTDSYVLEMALRYLGLKDVYKDLEEYIGNEFLK
jgi:GT2 family glycosyltransferase